MAIPGTVSRLEKSQGYRRLKAAGGMGELLVQTARAGVTRPFSWGGELVSEMALAFRRCWVPAVVGQILIATGGAIAWFSPMVTALGTPDRVSTGASHAWITEEADWIPLMALAGCAGAAMAADLGARKIREELEALRVLGSSPIRELVVPRVLALMIMGPVISVVGLLAADAAMWVFWPAYSGHDVTLHGYNLAMQLIRLPPDLYWLCAKAAITGLLIGVVCCYKGLNTSGGSEGVGRAVNEAVLITVAAVYAIDVLGNLAFYAWFPNLTILRG